MKDLTAFTGSERFKYHQVPSRFLKVCEALEVFLLWFCRILEVITASLNSARFLDVYGEP